jgi:hypothetical protein
MAAWAGAAKNPTKLAKHSSSPSIAIVGIVEL